MLTFLASSAVWQIEDYGLVHFLTLNPDEEDSVSELVQHMDHVLQFGEDEEVNTGRDPVRGRWGRPTRGEAAGGSWLCGCAGGGRRYGPRPR